MVSERVRRTAGPFRQGLLVAVLPAVGVASCLISPKDYPLGAEGITGGRGGELGQSGGLGAGWAGNVTTGLGGEDGDGGDPSDPPGGSAGSPGASGTPSTAGVSGAAGDDASGGAIDPGVGGAAVGGASNAGAVGGLAGVGGDTAAGSAGAPPGGSSSGGNAGQGASAGTTGEPIVKRVFVTSESFDGNLKGLGSPSDSNGLPGGDAICNAAAASAGLGGTWVAWLSVSGEAAVDRVADVAPWYLVDGTTRVFETHAQLTSPANVLVNMTETGQTINGRAWTGSTLSGVAHSARCAEWTSNNQGQLGAWGDLGNAFDWSFKNTDRCNTSAHLYCFEQ